MVVLNKDSLKLVFIEGLVAKFLELVTDVGEDCRLRVNFVILSALSNNATLDVAEKPTLLVKGILTRYSGFSVPCRVRESVLGRSR